MEEMVEGGPPAWGLGVGLTTPHRKKNKLVTKNFKKPRTWMDSLDEPRRRLVDNTKMDLREIG
jgi:hypothetical protein